jgi:hypothetical protein
MAKVAQPHRASLIAHRSQKARLSASMQSQQYGRGLLKVPPQRPERKLNSVHRLSTGTPGERAS